MILFSMIMIIVIWYALLNIVHLDHGIMSMHVLVVYYVHMYWIDLYQLILYSQDPIVYSIHVQAHLQHEISNIVHVDHIVVQPIIDNVIIKLSIFKLIKGKNCYDFIPFFTWKYRLSLITVNGTFSCRYGSIVDIRVGPRWKSSVDINTYDIL